MDCERIEELLSLYLEDELSEEEKSTVNSHVKACPACSSLLTLLRQTKESLSRFPEAEPSVSLLNRLYEIPQKKRKFTWVLDFWLRPSLQPVLATVTGVFLVLSFYMFHPQRNMVLESIDRQIHLGYSKAGHLFTKAESFADSLGAQKDSLLITLNTINPLDKNEE